MLSSPLARAWDTCRLAGLGDLAERCDDLMEWDYGAFEGLTSDQIQKDHPGWTIWTGEVPGGETVDAVGRRAARVIDRASAAGGDVLLFSHGHLLRVLGAVWLGFPAREGRISRSTRRRSASSAASATRARSSPGTSPIRPAGRR